MGNTLSKYGVAKIRAWQKVAGAPYGTYSEKQTANARRGLALYSSGIGDRKLYEPNPLAVAFKTLDAHFAAKDVDVQMRAHAHIEALKLLLKA